MKTSITDIDSYKNICQVFLDDENAFNQFRAYHKYYNSVLEHVTQRLGQQYLDLLLSTYPSITENWERVRLNDKIGKPRVYKYPFAGMFSPTTLRYTKVMADIYCKMGGFDIGKEVIEIGGGYGGQCRIINEFMSPERYTIVDLPVVNKLQEKYLSNYDTCKLEFVSDHSLIQLKGRQFDFVISNFAFDELLPEFQEIYFEIIIRSSKHGYLSGQYTHLGHMSIDRFKDWCDIREYTPYLGSDYHIITW